MSVVRGKNVIFSITSFWGDASDNPLFHVFSNRVVGCARSVTLTTTTSLIETTAAGTGRGATYMPQKNVTTGSLEGVVFLNEKDKVNLPTLRQMQLSQVRLHGWVVRTNEDGDTYKDIFDFFITSIADTGSVGDFNTFQMEFQVNGDPQITLSETMVPERTVEWNWSAFEPFITETMDTTVFPFPHSQVHTLNQTIEIPITGMPANRWLLVRFPGDEVNPTGWFNTTLNNGSIPDSVFYGVISSGGWKYLKTRTSTTFDATQTLKFTH